MSMTVLYEDNHLIAVYKPAGILSQGDKTGDTSMYEMVKDYIRIKKGKPIGNARPVRNSEGSQRKVSNGVFVGLLHRLDRPVSGIMLFAKTSKGASRLSEQFRNHEVEKTYQAIVVATVGVQPLRGRGVLVNNLGKDEKLKKAKEYSDGQEAKLYYEVIKSNGAYSLLQVRIEGGRFHQIRAQLSLAGIPILGDLKYKGQKWGDEGAIALCATGLSFKKATEDEMVNLTIEIPKEWAKYIT